mmetsp:Transcript_62199/g.160372  ORF Transcript_62199/g.160372 Transcript_62199/m.160372 type:complete len:270 (+) Transcript_62199:232-1041(+)
MELVAAGQPADPLGGREVLEADVAGRVLLVAPLHRGAGGPVLVDRQEVQQVPGDAPAAGRRKPPPVALDSQGGDHAAAEAERRLEAKLERGDGAPGLTRQGISLQLPDLDGVRVLVARRQPEVPREADDVEQRDQEEGDLQPLRVLRSQQAHHGQADGLVLHLKRAHDPPAALVHAQRHWQSRRRAEGWDRYHQEQEYQLHQVQLLGADEEQRDDPEEHHHGDARLHHADAVQDEQVARRAEEEATHLGKLLLQGVPCAPRAHVRSRRR